MTVRIITDSTADLPEEIATSLGITVVPLKVMFGENEYRDNVDINADQFYNKLIDAEGLPTTSQPSVGEFVEVYEEAAVNASGILSIHISAKLSGTYNSASLAKSEVSKSCPIELVDTLQASMGVGLIAIEAAKLANEGASLEEVHTKTLDCIARCETFALLDTLEYLEKGGRLGKAQAMIGNLLKLKPLLKLENGEVHSLSKERSKLKGITHLEKIAKGYGSLDGLAVLYSTTSSDIDGICNNLRYLLPDAQDPIVARLGPVLGTHTGPGALGIAVLKTQS